MKWATRNPTKYESLHNLIITKVKLFYIHLKIKG
uniref:Uncharacterized protein n=1 Tax=Strongyloides venezuelensis TaxID=75913 RepID=A0A0K0G653_STRVS